ncbi:hypothetical protein AB3N60_12700 [Leptospira sp. WS39.C2]
MRVLITLAVLFCIVGCKKKESSDTENTLLALFLLSPRDIVLEWGYPGSQNQIQNSELVGKTSGITLKVGGVTATGVSEISSDTIQFTMPTIPGISENQAVDFVIEKNGTSVFTTQVRYRPIVSWSINQPISSLRPIDGRDNKNFFQITATAANHVFNSFGHGFFDLDLYYFTSLNGTPIAFAEKRMNGAEFNKVLLPAGTVYIMAKHISGLGGGYNLQIANSGVVATTSAKLTYSGWTFNLCYDTMGTGPATANNCDVQMSVYNPTRSGRCTYPSDQGLTTRNYYLEGGFNTTYSQNTCLNPGGGSQNEAESIFIPN